MPIVARMDDSKIIDALGGTTEVARLCKVQPPSVSGWRVNGIPSARRQYLELLRPDVFAGADAEQDGDRRTDAPAHGEAADGAEGERKEGSVHGADTCRGLRPAA